MADDRTRWVEAQMEQLRALIVEEIEAVLPAKGPAPAYLDEPLRCYLRRPAKGLRAVLCLASCEAHGGTVEAAVPAAASIELLHSAFLVHDDIEDGSDLRRFEPALHHQIGTPLALNVGDALATLALRPLLDQVARSGRRVGALVLDEFHRMVQATIDGQALELGWRRDNVVDLSVEDYLRLVMLKTCWYTAVYPLRVGAIIGSGGRAPLEPLVSLGFHLGAAFQIQDDLLNLEGDEGEYGKEVLGDLLEGKRSLVLIHLLASVPPAERRALARVLAPERSARSLADARRLRELMDEHGSLEFARAFGRGLTANALEAFDQAFGTFRPSRGLDLLRAIIPHLLDRRA